MNLDFDDPNCLIDDSTPVEPETLDWVTALQGQQISVEKLEFSEDIQKLLKPAHFEAIKFSPSWIRVEENGATLETYVREKVLCPKKAREAFAAINQVMQWSIRYENIDGVERLRCDQGNSHPKRLDSREPNKYITAARYLPDLLLDNGSILVKPEQQERFGEFKRKYKIQTQWIEYYLLENSSILTELGFKCPTESQYKPGKISARLHELIHGIWFEAKNHKNPLCQWILSFDCPSQIWLAVETILVLRQWNKDKFPKNRHQLYQSEQPILKRLREHKGIKATLLYSDNEEENILSLDEAISFTLIRLLESGVELAQYKGYLKARTGQASHLRRGEKGKRSKQGFSTSQKLN